MLSSRLFSVFLDTALQLVTSTWRLLSPVSRVCCPATKLVSEESKAYTLIPSDVTCERSKRNGLLLHPDVTCEQSNGTNCCPVMLLVNRAKGTDYYLLTLFVKRYRLLPSDVTCEQSKGTDLLPSDVTLNRAKGTDYCLLTLFGNRAKGTDYCPLTLLVNKAKYRLLPSDVTCEKVQTIAF